MRRFSILLTMAASLILAVAAQAETVELWGDNSQFDPANRLGIDHVFYNNIDSGWFRDDGVHFAGNQSYQTGYCNCAPYYTYRGYFSFDLSDFAGNASVASFKVNNFDVGADSGTLALYGTGLTPADVDSQQNWNDIDKYDELNYGPLIGVISVTPGDSNQYSFITLTPEGVEWLNFHAGRGAVIGARWMVTPEPGGLALLATGLMGGIGILGRRLL